MIIGTTQEPLIPKGIKFCQVDEPQCFENEKNCKLTWGNYGGESFSFDSIPKEYIEAVKNNLQTTHQSQMTYKFQ